MRTGLLLATFLASASIAAEPWEMTAPRRLVEVGRALRTSGFQEALLREPTLARVENSRSGDFSLTVLPGGVRVELVNPEFDGEREVRALLADGRTAWVPPGVLEPQPDAATMTPVELHAPEDVRAYTPLRDLPRGVAYQFLYRQGARLHLVTVDLSQNPGLECFPFVTPRFHRRLPGREAIVPVSRLARRTRAFVALNGPFFIAAGRARGKPLGVLIADGEVIFELEDPYVLSRHRTYLAFTSKRRFVMGETGEPGASILRKNRADAFDRHLFEAGEQIEALVGGLGRLARRGDPDHWRVHAGNQFAERYYGRTARRPQSLVGTSSGGRVLHLLVQEGAPHSERCFTLPELSHVLHGMGAEEIAFSDGGGSAELVLMGRSVVRTENAGPRRPNSSVIVIRERPGYGTHARARSSTR